MIRRCDYCDVGLLFFAYLLWYIYCIYRSFLVSYPSADIGLMVLFYLFNSTGRSYRNTSPLFFIYDDYTYFKLYNIESSPSNVSSSL